MNPIHEIQSNEERYYPHLDDDTLLAAALEEACRSWGNLLTMTAGMYLHPDDRIELRRRIAAIQRQSEFSTNTKSEGKPNG